LAPEVKRGTNGRPLHQEGHIMARKRAPVPRIMPAIPRDELTRRITAAFVRVRDYAHYWCARKHQDQFGYQAAMAQRWSEDFPELAAWKDELRRIGEVDTDPNRPPLPQLFNDSTVALKMFLEDSLLFLRVKPPELPPAGAVITLLPPAAA